MNPIHADSNEEAAQRAAKAMSAVATDHPHYSNMNEAFARNFTVLARDYKRHRGRDPNEATLSDVYEFALKFEDLKKVVKASVEKGDDGERVARIDAPWFSAATADWLEQFYLPWQPRDRQHEVSGFVNYLDTLLSTAAARRCRRLRRAPRHIPSAPDPGDQPPPAQRTRVGTDGGDPGSRPGSHPCSCHRPDTPAHPAR